MSCPLTEFTIETIIRDGLGELRANPTRLDDLFSKFTATFFNNQYGQSKIDELKTYIANNQIKIVHSYNQVPTFMPCFSIQLLSSQEREDEQQFSNLYKEEDTSKTPNIIIPDVTPTAYDILTGKLTIHDDDDLSLICPGMNFVDNASNIFTIKTGNSNLSGNKFLTIASQQTVDIGGDGRVESAVDFLREDIRMIRLREVISLGCHANNDIHLSKYLYYILMYIIKSRQESLITRGVNLDSNVGTMFDRVDEYEGEHVYSRYIELNCLTEFDWNQGEVNIIDCFDLTIAANSGETSIESAAGTDAIEPDDPTDEFVINVNTSDDD